MSGRPADNPKRRAGTDAAACIRKRAARPLALMLIGCSAAGILAVLYWYPPTESDFYPICFFRFGTGWQCPGCGMTRAVHSLLHGEFGPAWAAHPLLVATLPFLLLGATLKLWERVAAGEATWGPVWSLSTWGLLVTWGLFGILRNVVAV